MPFVSKTGNGDIPSLSAEVENQKDLLIEAGQIKLSAAVHLPAKLPAPVIVCSHGLLSAKASPKFVAIGEQMSKAGFCVLRFDFSGCGDSPPRRGLSLVEARQTDLRAAIGVALEQPWSDGRIGLLGSSFGGFLSLLAANERPELIRATVSWAAPFDVSKINPGKERFEDLRTSFPDSFILGSPKDLSALGEAAGVLLIHGQLDEIVPWNNAVLIYERLRDPKRLMLMRTADHQVTDESWRNRAIQASLEWFLTYLI